MQSGKPDFMRALDILSTQNVQDTRTVEQFLGRRELGHNRPDYLARGNQISHLCKLLLESLCDADLLDIRRILNENLNSANYTRQAKQWMADAVVFIDRNVDQAGQCARCGGLIF